MPIWLLDRYQVEAAAKSLGGVDFPYAVNGEAATARTVPGAGQWAALYALLDTLSPAELTVPAPLQLCVQARPFLDVLNVRLVDVEVKVVVVRNDGAMADRAQQRAAAHPVAHAG